MSNIYGNSSGPEFSPFFDIEARSRTAATGPAHEVVPIFTGPTPLGLFATWQTGAIAHDLDAMEAVDEIVVAQMERMLAAVPDATLELIFQWQPITRGIVKKMEERGGNVLGLESVVADGPAFMYNLVFTADTEAHQAVVLPMLFEMNKLIQAKADEMGKNKNWEFLNYAHGSQDPLAHYTAKNIAFMKAVSRKFDRKQMFQRLRQTGFRL